MITFNKSDYDTILEYAKKNLPEEACGLIGGTIEDGDKHVKKVYLLTNIDHSNEHFSMDPKEQLAAVKDMRANGLVPFSACCALSSRRAAASTSTLCSLSFAAARAASALVFASCALASSSSTIFWRLSSTSCTGLTP